MAEYNFNFENDDLEKEALEREKLEKEKLEQEKLEQERLEQERLERERIERERLEKQRIEMQKAENKLFPNKSLFMIPSWSDLLGNPTLGTYVHHVVSKIESDPVIFFSSYDYSFETMNGTLHYLFGLGYYSLKFELESGKYITDNRILTGLVLSDFAYDHMATSASVTLEDDPDVIIAEKVVKVPIDLSNKSENHLSFIKGALMRNIFIPNKDIFLEMIDKIRDTDSYQISDEGHKILSSHWDYFNQILVSEKMRSKSDSSYLDSTAGLNGINYNSDTLLQNTLSADNLSIIEYSITNLKAIFSTLDFDPMYLFSILENAAPLLRSGDVPIPSKQRESSSKAAKASIFVSAEDRLFEFKSWPKEFMRKAKLEPAKIFKVLDQPTHSEPSYPDLGDRQIEDFFAVPKMEELKQEKFELDALKSQKVQAKSLPPPPIADINKILAYLKQVISEDYEMRSIGQAFEIARESVRHIGVSATTLHQAKIWEMSKYANLYIKKESGLGLSIKEKNELIQRVDGWIFEIEENARIERERLEQARLEKERLEKERIERERLERERQEKERLERIRLEKERIERERLEKERQEKERLERVRLEKEKAERERLERERLQQIQKEREEAQRLEEERLRKEREEQEALEREKQELERLKAERKQKEKAAKQEAKKKKKLEKQRKKIEKKKLKEQKKLKEL